MDNNFGKIQGLYSSVKKVEEYNSVILPQSHIIEIPGNLSKKTVLKI